MLKKVLKIIKEAGSIVLFYYYKNISKKNIFYKVDNSPVTSVDYDVNDFLIKELYKLTPDFPILSEENLPDIKLCKNWNTYWLIDPLDGTKEFINKIPEFTINICLIKKNIPLFGVIYIPYYKTLYYSHFGKLFKEVQGCKSVIKKNIYNNNNFIVSRSHYDLKIDTYLKKYKYYSKIKLGSSWKFCLIAERKAKCYLRYGNTGIWDTAAGESILNASGGCIKTFSGKNLDYSLKKSFLNPGFKACI
ncbi:3'(2'),5'-bisphosphate nucleotidase CysQ [Buchnera aphidicola]|uniref:3'(2'),5'-bisphosphate nucleotidase CysQ n=1 Tax=Buchnera aphidicola TaxID=9 RepID=UPI0031B8697D